MPRRPRQQCPTDTYHVTNRGVDHRAIAIDDDDRRTWFRLFDRAATRFNWRVFAYCLLDNHFHLYVRAALAALSDGMHDFEGGYATLFNKKHNRTGALFEGRFHPEPVETDAHSWELSRYIHLNPVRGDC